MRQRRPEPRVSAALGLHLDSTPQSGSPAAGLRPWWCVAGTQDALRLERLQQFTAAVPTDEEARRNGGHQKGSHQADMIEAVLRIAMPLGGYTCCMRPWHLQGGL